MNRNRLEILIATCVLVALFGFAIYHLAPSAYRLWFFSSDEYVVAAEVIRFVQFDFRQRFFDMPGTPYMVLCAILWWLRFLWAAVTGASGGLPIAEFTFDHLPELFYLMRSVTLFFYFLSLGLMFVLGRRLMNSGGGLAAAMLVAFSVPYATYSSFVRVESLALCLVLGALWITLHYLPTAPADWADQPASRAWILRFCCAGLLIGWAAATRLHSVTLTVPLFFLVFGLRERAAAKTGAEWVPSVWRAFAALFGCICIASWAAPWIGGGELRQAIAPIPAAVSLLRNASLASAFAALLIWRAYRSRKWNPAATKWAGPEITCLAVGMTAGVASGLFPLVTQSVHLGHSIQMYSTTYIDRARALLPLLENIHRYLSYYKAQFAPDLLTTALVAVGMTWIASARTKALVPFLVSAVLFFVSKPLNLVAALHHVIMWLPSWYICASYPVARLWAWKPVQGPLLASLLLAALAWTAPNGPAHVAVGLPDDYESRRNIERATAWIEERTKPEDVVAVGYYCFNKHVFFEWIEGLHVPIPPSRRPPGQALIWWGYRDSVAGKQGFACVAPRDVPHMKTDRDLERPGSGTDPYTDPAFRREATFGRGIAQVDVFRFDLR